MTQDERENWLANIEIVANTVAGELCWETVRAVLQRYDADSIDTLTPDNYTEVFSELFTIEADMKD